MKKKIIISLLLSFLILTNYIFGFQTDTLILKGKNSVKVDSILVIGNEKTESFIVLRELTFKSGDVINKQDIDYNKERVYSLGIFNFAKIILIKEFEIITAVIEVEESWYIYPIPFVYAQDGEYKEISYGLSLLYKNFRGRNETINSFVSLGYNKTFYISYYNPVINKTFDLNLTTALIYQSTNNRSGSAFVLNGSNFEYKTIGGSVALGKRFTQFTDAFLLIGYNYIEAPSNLLSPLMASKSLVDESLILGATYIYDTRNLKQFPSDGILMRAGLLNKGIGSEKINYNIFSIDYREYRPLVNKITGKWRVAYRNTFGKFIPFYDYSYFGFEQYIRGHRSDEREGHDYFLTSAELSYPLIRDFNVSFDIPPIPKQLSSARIEVHINIFTDAGITYNNRENWDINNFDSGWGAGISILFLPYNSVRMEYALNKYGKGELLFGTGFSF
ncbi:MAG: hypothetical protein KJ799_02320 [Bacteroidetes bacterium]|nr:hypothetical protein [Bacteroidota bacterium]